MNPEFQPLYQLLVKANADINFKKCVEPFLGHAVLLSSAYVSEANIAAEAQKRAEKTLSLSMPDGKFSKEDLLLKKEAQKLIILRDNEELLKKGNENIKNCCRYVNVMSGMESKREEMKTLKLYPKISDKECGFDVVMPKSVNVMKHTEDMLIIKVDKSMANEKSVSINFELPNAAKDKNLIDEAAGGVPLMENRQLQEFAEKLIFGTLHKANETFLKLSLQEDWKVSAEEKKQKLPNEQNEQIKESPLVERFENCIFKLVTPLSDKEQKLYWEEKKRAENEQKSDERKQKEKVEREQKLHMDEQKVNAENEQKLYMNGI